MKEFSESAHVTHMLILVAELFYMQLIDDSIDRRGIISITINDIISKDLTNTLL